MAYVLVVDDEEAIRRLLIRWLSSWGYESREAVMASSAQDMDTVLKMRKHGAVDYVTKPFGRELLLQALRRASEKLHS